MTTYTRQDERLVALLLLGFLAINYPLLSLFNRSDFWLGIPILYCYLFLFWLIFIGAVALVVERPHKKTQSKNEGPVKEE